MHEGSRVCKGRGHKGQRSDDRVVLERVKGIEPSSSAWKAVALPLSYTRFEITEDGGRMSTRAICPLSSSVLCRALGGGGRTRTYEGVSQRIYSPPPLPLGSVPRRRTSYLLERTFLSAGRVYAERA